MVRPSTVSQISTYDSRKAEYAVDGDLSTYTHTKCLWDTSVWYKMKFDAIYCFSEVVIMQSHLSYSAFRMDDMKVLVVNNGERTESLCGFLRVKDVRTIEGHIVVCQYIIR